MRTHARVVAATLIGLFFAIGLTTACTRTTEGVVAQTTQPGPPLTTAPRTTAPRAPSLPGLPDFTIPNIPLPTRGTNVPQVPAPANSLTMECREFNGLDEATKRAVVQKIIEENGTVFGSEGSFLEQILADTGCQLMPTARVSEVLLASMPG
ncbi:hypothetical protein [Mycobacterium sp. SMC-4]|uniref:hypothetical protein n=1 Tax=Mycobacterium sp. SMC-4 TaxID=2857059 RepID=UPI0021B3546E|nr:hypothetical protein [Mycobacterium sp. SMC-4]UXA17833.1 hypothetical protein KXD98_24605 [Mycobacterium sp. SMC-4]